MLVAADILSQHGRGSSYTHDLIFVSLSGEAFDLMASRRLLYEMTLGANSTVGLDINRTEAVVEVGMLGGVREGQAVPGLLYLHSAGGDQSQVVAALKNASTMLDEGALVRCRPLLQIAMAWACMRLRFMTSIMVSTSFSPLRDGECAFILALGSRRLLLRARLHMS
jgi:hypothetical protein